MNWEYKRLSFVVPEILNLEINFHLSQGWEVQSHATGPKGEYITVMKRKLNSKAVDYILNDGCLFLEPTDNELAQIIESAKRVPISEENRRKAIQTVVRRRIKFHGWTTHRACQEIATKMGYSYECIREIIDDDQGS